MTYTKTSNSFSRDIQLFGYILGTLNNVDNLITSQISIIECSIISSKASTTTWSRAQNIDTSLIIYLVFRIIAIHSSIERFYHHYAFICRQRVLWHEEISMNHTSLTRRRINIECRNREAFHISLHQFFLHLFWHIEHRLTNYTLFAHHKVFHLHEGCNIVGNNPYHIAFYRTYSIVLVGRITIHLLICSRVDENHRCLYRS